MEVTILEQLKLEVYKVNMDLQKHNLVTFSWGKDVNDAVHNAVVIEEVATMANYAEVLSKNIKPIPQHISYKYFSRKHGKNAYYGQGIG